MFKGGRHTLIQVAHSSMSIYYLSLYAYYSLIVSKTLDKLIRDFFREQSTRRLLSFQSCWVALVLVLSASKPSFIGQMDLAFSSRASQFEAGTH